MNAVPPSLIDVDEFRAEIREQVQAQVRKQYRNYGIVLLVMGLIVDVVIGISVTRDKVQPAAMLTPPSYWGEMCVPAARVDGTIADPTVTPEPLQVYISGAVTHPGVVTLPVGSLLADALEAVGGAADDADLDSINLAAPLADNEHVIVPRHSATPQPAVEVEAAAPAVVMLVNINTATGAELEMLPHIGPAMAQRIIDYREAHGPFARIEDLQEVEGIGETRYKDLAPLITVK